MRGEDQKQLEFLYEQMAEDFTLLLDEERKLAERVSKRVTSEVLNIIVSRMYNNEKIDFEYLIDLITPNYGDVSSVFGIGQKVVEKTYNYILIHDIYEMLVYVKLKDGEPHICFRSAETVIDPYSSMIECVCYRDEELVEGSLCNLIQDVILVRYKAMVSPKNLHTVYLKEDMEWVRWRREKLRFRDIKVRLPELGGIF